MMYDDGGMDIWDDDKDEVEESRRRYSSYAGLNGVRLHHAEEACLVLSVSLSLMMHLGPGRLK